MKNKTGYAFKKTDDEILGALCTILWKRNNILGLKNLFVFLSLLTNCCIFCICMRLTFKIYLQRKTFIDNKNSIFFRLRENKSHPF